MHIYRSLAKPVLDITIAGLAILVLSPLLAFISLVLLVMQGWPIIYHQQRTGHRGRVFNIIKFRTMADTRNQQGNLLPDEDRITRIGKLLRASSLDELPELYNVLKGEMSLIGPRPLLVQYLTRYSTEQMRRHEARPGITGWAQVNGRNALSWAERFQLDNWYVDNCSFQLDARIIFLTIRKILIQEGINAEGHVSMPEFTGCHDNGSEEFKTEDK